MTAGMRRDACTRCYLQSVKRMDAEHACRHQQHVADEGMPSRQRIGRDADAPQTGCPTKERL